MWFFTLRHLKKSCTDLEQSIMWFTYFNYTISSCNVVTWFFFSREWLRSDIPTSIQKWKLKNLINEKFNRRKDKYKIKHNTFKFYTYYYNISNKNIIKRIVSMLSLCLLITSRILVKCSYQGWNSIVFFGIKNNSKKMFFVFSIEFDFSRKYTEHTKIRVTHSKTVKNITNVTRYRRDEANIKKNWFF